MYVMSKTFILDPRNETHLNCALCQVIKGREGLYLREKYYYYCYFPKIFFSDFSSLLNLCKRRRLRRTLASFKTEFRARGSLLRRFLLWQKQWWFFWVNVWHIVFSIALKWMAQLSTYVKYIFFSFSFFVKQGERNGHGFNFPLAEDLGPIKFDSRERGKKSSACH